MPGGSVRRTHSEFYRGNLYCDTAMRVMELQPIITNKNGRETVMETQNTYAEETEVEIDLWALFGAIRKNIAVIILATVAAAIVTYLGTVLFITPTYDSTTKIYVLNKQDDSMSTVTYNDLQTATQLTKDYMELVTTRPVLEEVISSLGLDDVTYEDLKGQITVSTATDGRIISITATDKDPGQAKNIADSVRNSVSAQILQVMNVEAVNVVEEANLPEQKARPSNVKNAALGGILGLFIALAAVVLKTILDDRIKTEEDVERYLQLSVLGTIPLEEQGVKKSMKKSKSRKKKFRSRSAER